MDLAPCLFFRSRDVADSTIAAHEGQLANVARQCGGRNTGNPKHPVKNQISSRTRLRQIRWISGITAFPLLHELNTLTAILGVEHVQSPAGQSGLTWWILYVRQGLETTYAQFPFIAYGTDWLALGHLVIALFFIGPLIDPVRNVWILRAGLIACVAQLPTRDSCTA